MDAMVLSVKILPATETRRVTGKLPIKAFASDAGFDLFPTIDAKLYPGERLLVPTGVSLAIPSGYYGRIAERSGYGSKGLGVGAGVIDSGYRGEICVVVYNRRFTDDDHEVVQYDPIVISPDKAVAQIIMERCDPFRVDEVDELPPADRGERGFGSSDGR